MRKLTVYLTDEDVAVLALLSGREGVSQAEIIRRAIRVYAPEHRRRRRRLALTDVADGPGGSIAQAADADLLEGFGS